MNPTYRCAKYTIQCNHPETGQLGSWIFSGGDHRIPGTSLSPVFPDVGALFIWMNGTGWHLYNDGTHPMICRKRLT